ncbi:S41 family peptidase [Frigoribacterium salinisoli]
MLHRDRARVPSRSRTALLVGVGVVAQLALVAGVAVAAAPELERFGVFLVPPSPQRYAEIALDRMRDGLDADGPRYAEVRERTLAEVAPAQDYAGTYAALARAAGELGGEHTAFLEPAEAAAIFGGGPATDASGAGDADEPPALPTVTTTDGVTTLTLPTLVGGDADQHRAYVEAGAQGLVDAAPATTSGWVVDLRDNHGGDLWPMLAAVSPLLDEGRVLSFEHRDRSDVVEVGGGVVTLRGAAQAATTAGRLDDGLPVAVVVDGMTGSSAEAVAIAFIGQEGVRVLGRPSYGVSTSNEPRRLYDGAVVNLTVAVDADRTGTRHGGPIVPDVVVGDDAELAAALEEWWSSRG